MLHISLAAETIWHLGVLPITNSLVTTWVLMAVFIAVSAMVTSRLRKHPGSAQLVAELLVGGLYDFFQTILANHTKKIYPLIATFFIFIIFSNWSGLLPGVGSIGFYHAKEAGEEQQLVKPAEAASEVRSQEKSAAPEFTPLFRAPTADLNTTLALALIAVVFIQYYGFKTLGLNYGKKFINLTNPIMFFVGVLEIVSEFSRIISYGFRLFGNIFAGEVLLAVMAFLMPFVLPTPFIALEIFVGFIQALVFALLTAVFLNVAVSHEESH